ncbi:MAG TPA: c-type cytochrome [Trueperaceae bacterium]|nr:c-type cytochrome [Trueperaceae bacterium]
MEPTNPATVRSDRATGEARVPAATSRPVLLALAGLAAVVCASVVTQVFLAGLGLLVDPRYLAWHSAFVHVIEASLLGAFVLGLASRSGWVVPAVALALFGLVGLQYALIHGADGPTRALHAVNALVLFALSWVLARRAVAAAVGGGHTSASRPERTWHADYLLAGGIAALATVAIAAASAMVLPDASTGPASSVSPADAISYSADAPGAELFAANCSGCHGDRGQGRVGPRLAGNAALRDRGYVVDRVRGGGGIMPAFRLRLSDDEIEAVVDYVRSAWAE